MHFIVQGQSQLIDTKQLQLLNDGSCFSPHRPIRTSFKARGFKVSQYIKDKKLFSVEKHSLFLFSLSLSLIRIILVSPTLLPCHACLAALSFEQNKFAIVGSQKRKAISIFAFHFQKRFSKTKLRN